MKKYIQSAAFFLFIIGLPLGSWYYLQAGFDYNKDLMSELNDYGRVAKFSLVDQNGRTWTREEIEGKVMVVSFFNQKQSSFPKTMDYLRRMYSQFHDRDDLIFASHSLQTESLGPTELNTIASKEKLNNKQNIFLSGSEAQLTQLIKATYQIPDLNKRGADKKIPRSTNVLNLPDDYPFFVLVDDSGTIRNYYDINNENSVIRLVEHLALILPRKKEEKAKLKRETEK